MWPGDPEVIGPPDCPIMYRWTLCGGGSIGKRRSAGSRVKLMLHHFPPNADDRDMHDHPRPFYTLVLKGYYDNLVQCPRCGGDGGRPFVGVDPAYGQAVARRMMFTCTTCNGSGVVVGERMRAGMLRLRLARHIHRTRVGPGGCWTLVLMGPLRRSWGFWRGRRWWFWKDYEAEFGFAMRCDDLEKEYRR